MEAGQDNPVMQADTALDTQADTGVAMAVATGTVAKVMVHF